MTNKEQIFNALERLGYKPQYDDDGDIMLRYQLKHIFSSHRMMTKNIS